MRHVFLFYGALACSLCAGASVRSQESIVDGIGIYCDQDGLISCCLGVPIYSMPTMYVIATKLSEPSGIANWEAKILFNPSEWPAGFTWTVAGEGAVFVPQHAPVFRVTVPGGLAAADQVLLLTMTSFYLGQMSSLGLAPVSPSNVAGAGPAYLSVADPTRWVALRVMFGGLDGHRQSSTPWPDEPNGFLAAMINDLRCRVFDADAGSWSAVKRLYQ